MHTPSIHAIPELAEGTRISWDHDEHAHVLIYPDGMVVLNARASKLFQLCDGCLNIDQILSQFDPAQLDGIGAQQLMMELDTAAREGWLNFR